PEEGRTFIEPNGSHGIPPLLVLLAVAVGASGLLSPMVLSADAPIGEAVVVGTLVGGVVAFALAVLNKVFGFGLLSQIAERVTFVMIPPLALIFLVLGTIFLGIATPTEGGAMGAVGAIIMALARKRLS